jgi:hypothetical protein
MYKITLNNIELKINYAKVYYQVHIYLFQIRKISQTALKNKPCRILLYFSKSRNIVKILQYSL